MRPSPLISTLPLCLIILSSCSPDVAHVEALIERVAAVDAENRSLAAQVAIQRKLVESGSSERESLSADRSHRELLVKQIGNDISALKADFAAYKGDYRRAIQARATGMTLTDFTVGTKFYGDVKVSSVTGTELTILTGGGVARVPLADVSPAVQELFAYDASIPPAVAGPRITGGTDSRFLDHAIEDGKRTAAENKLLIQKMREAKTKKKTPRYLKAPSPVGTSRWSTQTSFEGSYWAPYKRR